MGKKYGLLIGVCLCAATAVAEYRLGPDDRITVDAIGAPEIAGREYRIDPGGEVRLPMIGSIGAEGRTPAEVEQEIRARLDRYIRDPQVSVAVHSFGSRPVSVLGQVATPGVHQ
ncbi:MAG: polysaccharide biosynthesis/export family protein, partial [Bryobacterales bacterium]